MHSLQTKIVLLEKDKVRGKGGESAENSHGKTTWLQQDILYSAKIILSL